MNRKTSICNQIILLITKIIHNIKYPDDEYIMDLILKYDIKNEKLLKKIKKRVIKKWK